MRIGEILLLREVLDPWVLTQSIQQQPGSRQRLVSLLVSRALIDPDDGTLALSEQHDYPGAMQRHLERRDPALAELVPAEIGRRWVVLPLGKSRRGGLVVVARDPTPILQASLEHVTKMPVELAVTVAAHLERLVRSIYGELDPDPALEAAPRISGSLAAIDVSQLSLSEHEPMPPPTPTPRTVSRMLDPALPTRTIPSVTKELDGTLTQIDRAINRAAAEQHAITFASRLWQSALLLRIADGAALGRRGHGPRLGAIDSIILPIDEPSLVQVAYETRGATIKAPGGVVQERLAALLGDPAGPAAAPVIVAGNVEAVLVVGEPSSELRNPLGKLAALADALGSAYERLGTA
ncbi:MAG: hypothetical protein SFX73_39290 [Kofleriaceae bacterium]|nr:hypothetical protein [Kofleriaceae bacterium]